MAELSPDLAVQLRQWRHEEKCIVFTNGVFDLIHPGHAAQLEAAKSFGDVLVVGLNSDRSVAMLGKGPERPVLNELARRALLLSIRWVDAVAIFHEPTPEHLITQIRPNVLVKGSDYKVDEVVGSEFVKSYGGEVILVPLLPGYSTTSIIERIRSTG